MAVDNGETTLKKNVNKRLSTPFKYWQPLTLSNRIFAAVASKQATLPDDPIEYSFEQLASRFDYYLKRLHNKNDVQRGIMLFDKSFYEQAIQSLARKFRENGHRWGELKNLAEVPFFSDSKSSRLIQMADMVSYAIFRKFEYKDDRYYTKIVHRFDADGNTTHGLYVKE